MDDNNELLAPGALMVLTFIVVMLILSILVAAGVV